MRAHALSFILLASLALAYAVPTPAISEVQSTESKIEPVEQASEVLGDDKERAKKSATTFCVEVRPSEHHVKECSCNQCAEKSERVIVQPAPPQPCQQIVEPPKPKPTLPPPPPPTHKPRPVHKPMPLPVPQETVRPLPPACAEPQVYVMPSNPMIIMPEHHEAPKPVHHHSCHKCGHQQPLSGCQCSSCRAAQFRNEQMGYYEPHLASSAHMMRHDAMQQKYIYPSPGMTMYGGDIAATEHLGDAARNGGMGIDMIGERSNPNILIHTDLPPQPPRTYRQESQTPYYVTIADYPQYPYPNGNSKPRTLDDDSSEVDVEESSHTVAESFHESAEAGTVSEADVESSESFASEADDMNTTVMKRDI